MLKKSILLAITLTIGLVFILQIGDAKAGPSEFYFDQWNDAYVEVVDMGVFGAAQWAILAKVDLDNPVNIGLGFSFYHTGYGDLALHIMRDEAWYSHTWEGVWGGSGSDFVLSVSWGYMDIHQLWTTPPSLDANAATENPTRW